jgi:AmiR/NasT family two-component response regulator
MNPREKSHAFRSLRIVVADCQQEMPDFYTTMLPRMGHKLVHLATSGRELIKKCRELEPDLVISDIRLPDMDAATAEQAVSEERPVPFIVLTAANQPQPMPRSGDGRVLATLVKPVGAAQLEVQIPLVMQWFEQIESLRREIAALQ